jgi:hypothetical protein
MSAVVRKKSVRVYEFLDDHPNYSRALLKDVFKKFKKKLVDCYYDRWHKKQKLLQTPSGPSNILQNGSSNQQPKKQKPKIPDIVKKTAELMEYYNTRGLKVSLNDVKTLLSDTRQLTVQQSNIPPYRRPAFFNPKQNFIINEIISGKYKIIMIEGDQRTGKSTLVFDALHEIVLERHPRMTQIDIMAGKGDQARRILKDLTSDPLLSEVNKNLLMTVLPSGQYLQWFNGSRIDSHETTVNDIKGSDSHIIIIEELDRAVIKDPQAVMSALFTLRARTDLLVIMLANMDKGAYLLIREILMKPEWRDQILFVTLTKKDSPHLQLAGNDPLLTDISNAICGEAFTQRRLENINTGSGDQFDSQTLRDAIDVYESLYNTTFKSETPWFEVDFNVMSVDPSQMGHPFGWVVAGVMDSLIIEWCSGMMQMGVDKTGQKWSPDRINMFVYKKTKDYRVKIVYIENNTYGPALSLYLQQHNVTVILVNRGADGNYNSVSNYLSVARAAFDDHIIAMKSLDAKSQLTLYDITLRNKNKHKGDLADAWINLIWHALGGLNYIATKNQKSKSEQTTW